MKAVAEELNDVVNAAMPALRRLGSTESGQRPAPGKWSAREIIGHLIDSAVNNHVRFARAALEDDLVFAGYGQNEWVELQQYGERGWLELVDLWASYNRHLAALVARIPDEAMTRVRTKHNLDETAWKTVPRTQPVTLEYFVRDYVAHLKHHLGRINND